MTAAARALYQKAYRAAHRDALLQKKRAYYQDNKDAHAARCKANYDAKPAEYAARNRASYLANKDARAAYQKKYRAKNVERTRVVKCAQQNRRRAYHLFQLCGCCTQDALRRVYEIAPLVNGEVDHKIALALGGHHCVKNLQVLSLEEHAKKTASDMRRMADARLRNKLLRHWPAGELSSDS